MLHDYEIEVDNSKQLKLRAGKRMFTHCLHTLKGKPSRINKRTKILSRFDVKIHRMNG